MIFAGDLTLAMPTKDIYDTNIMLAAINAAKDSHDQAIKDQELYNKTYGDFTSPVGHDLDYWLRLTVGRVQNVTNWLFLHGIAPDSAEGRSIILRTISNTNTANLAKLKQSKEAGDLYNKMRALMAALGKYNPDFERHRLGGKTLEEWDTLKDGVWKESTPLEYKTLLEFVHPSFETIKPHTMSKDEVEARGYKYDPRYIYKGVSTKDMANVMNSFQPGVKGNPLYEYYYDLAKLHLIDGGADPSKLTDLDIKNEFTREAIIADHGIATPLDIEEDPYAMQAQKLADAVSLENLRSANAIREKQTPSYSDLYGTWSDRHSSSNRSNGGDPSHSHASEILLSGILNATGVDSVTIQNPLTGKTELNPQIFEEWRWHSHGGHGTTHVSPSMLTQALFPLRKNADNGVIPVNANDLNRLTGTWVTKNKAFNKIDRKITNMIPTGDVHVLREVHDGKIVLKTYAKVEVYNQSGTHIGSRWYDTHLQTRPKSFVSRREVNTDDGGRDVYFGNTKVDHLNKNDRRNIGYYPQEQFNVDFDTDYPEIEAIDRAGFGSAFGDKASMTDADAQFNIY